jgi:hypothetical protein
MVTYKATIYPRQFHFLNADSSTVLSLKKGPATIGQLKKKLNLMQEVKTKMLTRACGGPPPFGGLRVECRITSPAVLQAKQFVDDQLGGGLVAFCDEVEQVTGTQLQFKLISIEEWLQHFHHLWSRVVDQGLLNGQDGDAVSADKFRAYHDLVLALGINSGNIGGNWTQDDEYAWYAQDALPLDHTRKYFLLYYIIYSCTSLRGGRLAPMY